MVLSKKISFVAIVMFIIFFVCSRSDAGTLLFSDDFESGTLTGYSTSLVTISTERAHSGTRSVKATHSGTVIFSKTLDTALLSPYTEITIRYWWFTSTTWPIGYGVKWSRLRGPSQVIQMENWWAESIGTDVLNLGGNVYGNTLDTPGSGWSGAYYGPRQSINRGRWMQVELYYKLNTIGQNDGIYRISFDGSVVYNRTGVHQRNTNVFYNQFYFISNIGTSNANCINFVDDVEIWAGIPGASTPGKTLENANVIDVR